MNFMNDVICKDLKLHIKHRTASFNATKTWTEGMTSRCVQLCSDCALLAQIAVSPFSAAERFDC